MIEYMPTIIAENWKNLLTEFEQKPHRQLIYVLGPTDSGKTTFCRFVHDNLKTKFLTAYIDCDPGQSLIGPPTTLGLEFHPQNKQEKKVNYLHFIGSTSPLGHLLQTLTGIKKLTEKVIHLGAEKIILDSSGFVLGKPAKEFQFQVIDLLLPDQLVILQKYRELQSLSLNFEKHPRIKIHRLAVSSAVSPRTQVERQNYRQEKFKHYFKFAKPQELCWKGIGFHGRIPHLRNPQKYRNRLIALCDVENFVVTLGIVRSVDFYQKILIFNSPPFDPAKVASIQFGSIYLYE